MLRHRLQCVACLLVVALWPMPARAQEPTPLGGYRISSWMEEDGLPAGSIWALAQDAEGFLWIGCDAGLVRFDGARFRTWRDLGGAELPQGSVHAIVVAHDGVMWLAFAEQRVVARVDGRRITTYGPEHGLDAEVTSLAEDRTGRMWAGTDNGTLQFVQGRWQKPADGGVSGSVIALTVTGKGDLYAATVTAIYKRKAGDTAFIAAASTPGVMQGMAVDSHERLWVTDRNFGYRALAPSAAKRPPSALRGKGYRLLPDSKGNLWVATYGQGVWQLRVGDANEIQSIQSVTDFQGLSNNVIYSLLEDRNGNIWAGTTAGLNRLAPQRLMQVEDLGVVTGVAVTSPDTVWANTADGLTRFVRRQGEWRREQQAPTGVRAEVLQADTEGRLWVASDAGLERLAERNGRIFRERVAAPLRQIKSISTSGDGTVWALDTERGLFRWRDGTLTEVPIPPSAGRRVSSIFADRTRGVWFALQGQSVVIRRDADGQTRSYGGEQGYAAGYPRMFYEDRDGVLWIAGSLGLARFKNNSFVTLKRDAHLPLDGLTSVIEDDAGRMWLGTAAGILRISHADFDAAAAHRWDEVSPATFDAADGVAGTTGWIGQPSATRSSDGRLWFLTASGMTIVDPRAMQDTTPTGPTRVDVVSIDDQRVAVDKPITVPSTATRLQIEFTVPTLSPSQQTRFRYRLDGFDTAWINSGRLRTAIYTNLPPRKYQFEVQLQDAAGTWPAHGAGWQFSVEPAFYQTAWFMVLCATIVIAAGWSAWKFRVTQVRRQLAIVHGERSRLSREIHDTLLQSLVGVALQCDALADAPDLEAANKGLLTLRRQVESYVRECRQSLWNLRSPMLEAQDLPTVLRDIAARATATGTMRLDMNVSGTARRSPGRIDEQLLRIGQEAVTNAVRHSHAHAVTVRLDYGPSDVRLSIHDDGKGFDPHDPTHAALGHWGLVGMQERAKAINADISIGSEPGRGSEVVVSVPLPAASVNDGQTQDQRVVHGRSPDRPRGHRPDHQPAA